MSGEAAIAHRLSWDWASASVMPSSAGPLPGRGRAGRYVVDSRPVSRTAPVRAPFPGASAVISIVGKSWGSTPPVIVTVVDPELLTTKVPALIKMGWRRVLPGAAYQHS